MLSSLRRVSLLVLISLSSVLVYAIPLLTITGAKLFLSTGDQFFIKGVAYTPQNNALVDVLSNGTQCNVDIAQMKDLGVNSVRVYYVDSGANHTDCMNAYAAANIYLWIALSQPDTTIDGTNPQWTNSQFLAYAKVIDAFSQYDNTAAFWIPSEVVRDSATSIAAPYVKAVARDMKAYQASQNYRAVPLGYSGNDDVPLRSVLLNYFACGYNRSETIDFYGLNQYSWCGDSTFVQSGYDQLTNRTANYSIPIFFSETGCNLPNPRKFEDQTALLGPQMNDIFSGSMIYSWLETGSQYGLVNDDNGSLSPISSQGYDALKSQWKTLTPTGTPSVAYYPTLKPPACPDSTSGVWSIGSNPTLPPTPYVTLPLKALSTTGAAGATTGIIAGAAPGSTQPANQTPKTASSGKLGGGAIAGIVVGALIGLALIVAAVVILVSKRRKAAVQYGEYHYEKAELPGNPPQPSAQPVEIDSYVPPANTSGLYEASASPTITRKPLQRQTPRMSGAIPDIELHADHISPAPVRNEQI